MRQMPGAARVLSKLGSPTQPSHLETCPRQQAPAHAPLLRQPQWLNQQSFSSYEIKQGVDLFAGRLDTEQASAVSGCMPKRDGRVTGCMY